MYSSTEKALTQPCVVSRMVYQATPFMRAPGWEVGQYRLKAAGVEYRPLYPDLVMQFCADGAVAVGADETVVVPVLAVLPAVGDVVVDDELLLPQPVRKRTTRALMSEPARLNGPSLLAGA